MDKLIELLKFKDGYEDISYRKQSDGAYMFWLDGMAYREERLLGNRFGFIEWLVENEKIDLNKIEVFSIFKEDRYYNAYQSILMTLAIHDNPIEFLISILK